MCIFIYKYIYTRCPAGETELFIKKNGAWEKELYFPRLLDEVAADPNALFSTLKPPPEGRGEVVGGDVPDDPFPGGLQAVLVQSGPR